jgi:hypothetical protein
MEGSAVMRTFLTAVLFSALTAGIVATLVSRWRAEAAVDEAVARERSLERARRYGRCTLTVDVTGYDRAEVRVIAPPELSDGGVAECIASQTLLSKPNGMEGEVP